MWEVSHTFGAIQSFQHFHGRIKCGQGGFGSDQRGDLEFVDNCCGQKQSCAHLGNLHLFNKKSTWHFRTRNKKNKTCPTVKIQTLWSHYIALINGGNKLARFNEPTYWIHARLVQFLFRWSEIPIKGSRQTSTRGYKHQAGNRFSLIKKWIKHLYLRIAQIKKLWFSN